MQQAVSNTEIRLWGNPEELLKVTKQFLEPEVNIDISNPEFLRDRIIDEDYVQRVKTWLPKGLVRLFASQTGLAFLVTAIVPTLILLLSHFTGVRAEIGNWVLVPAVALGLLSWILLLEMRSRTLLATAFDDTEKRTMDALLGEYWILWKVRGLGFVSSGLPLIISIIALSVLLS